MGKELTITEQRNAIVRKDNDLIQRSKFSMTAEQQKLMCFLISKIKTTDTQFQEYEFQLTTFMKVCGLDDSGRSFKQLKDSLLNMASKTAWLKRKDGSTVTVHLLEKVILNQDGTVTIRFDDDLRPYLLQLGEGYASYPLFWVLTLQSKYSIRMLEYLYSIQYKIWPNYYDDFEWEMTLDQIRDRLDAGQYKRWIHLRDRVIIPVVEELNEKTDKTVEYFPIKKEVGKGVAGVRFVIRNKDTIERIQAQSIIEKTLDGQPLVASLPPSADAHSFAGESVVGYTSSESAPSGSEPEEPKRKPKPKASTKTATKKKAESPSSTPLPDTIRTKKK